MKLIDKDALVAEIEKLMYGFNLESDIASTGECFNEEVADAKYQLCKLILSFIDNLEVKEVEETEQRMKECPYRQVGCTMYEDKVLECRGACSWVVDYLKLKELKAQKGEKV